MIQSLAILLTAGVALPLLAQTSGDWPMYSHDLAATRFSSLSQISTQNVARLAPAWTFRLNARGMEVTPIVVNGILYLTAGKRVVALEPETGKEIWNYELATGNAATRGLAYWPGDHDHSPRIVFTAGSRMLALNAKTGKIDPGFGKEGEVDLGVGYNAPPTVYKNLLFVGANVPEQPATGAPGDTRAYDARTGAKVWNFHAVPHAGEAGNETWERDAWKDRTGVNNWGFFMTVDAERGILYTVFGSPASDYYMEPTVRATTSSAIRLSLWMPRPESSSGISRLCITTCGTSISRPPLFWPMFGSTAV